MPLLAFVSPCERKERICSHLKLVRAIAGRLHRQYPHSELNELIQVGALGLIAGIDHDDGRHSTGYVAKWIRGAMLRSLGGRRRELTIVTAEPAVPDASAVRYELQEALASLEPMEREILLRRFEGYTRAELATAIQVSPGRIQAYEQSAIARLRARERRPLRAAA
jgi:RNA polymerase sigma factor (sigma-70 family)